MELFRELGLEEAVEATGLGPDWTAVNLWADSLAVEPYATIPSPTFHSIPRSSSPCVPVMTAQDEVESALMALVANDPNITVRFETEATELSQSEDGAQLTLVDTTTGDRECVSADYVLAADGPGSGTRSVVGAQLEAEPRPIFSQDVIFDADLDAYVGDRKGSLLYATTSLGVVIFQPLDGRRRWRCQVVVSDANLISEDAARARIRAALGTEDDVPLNITSMRMWQPTPGCATHFGAGRVFLAGDAAHVSVPTGGMGNNIGFAGVRNLAWKLAYVIRGFAPQSILDTYEIEHRPVAVERIAFGVSTTNFMGRMIMGHRRGEDVSEHVQATHQYADYDHVLLGFALASDLIAADSDPPPAHESSAFTPTVRAGGRAPHVWIDEPESQSVLDWFGLTYVLLLGARCSLPAWDAALAELPPGGVPVVARQLPEGVATAPYKPDEVVLVRPDGIIAQRHIEEGKADVSAFAPYLPRPTEV